MGLRKKIAVYEEHLLENGWSVMPCGEVDNSSSVFKVFKYSNEVDLCTTCEILKENRSYQLVFEIKDILRKFILQRTRRSQKNEIFRWLMRCTFGDSAAYLSGHTNIKEIKEIYKKYEKNKSLRGGSNSRPTVFLG